MSASDLLEKIEQVIEPLLDYLGFELVERVLIQGRGRWILRLYIDGKEKPVTLDDCEKASRAMESVLDVENLISTPYVLEVSSPGEERPLRKERDFERFAGSFVRVALKEPMEGRNHLSGILKGLRGKEIWVVEGQKEWFIPLTTLKKAKIKNLKKGDVRYGNRTDPRKDNN